MLKGLRSVLVTTFTDFLCFQQAFRQYWAGTPVTTSDDTQRAGSISEPPSLPTHKVLLCQLAASAFLVLVFNQLPLLCEGSMTTRYLVLPVGLSHMRACTRQESYTRTLFCWRAFATNVFGLNGVQYEVRERYCFAGPFLRARMPDNTIPHPMQLRKNPMEDVKPNLGK